MVFQNPRRREPATVSGRHGEDPVERALIRENYAGPKGISMKLTWYGLCLVALLAAGCGGSNRAETHPVSGKITYEGEPVADAHVVFHPTGDSGVIARGKTDEDGYYELTTYDTDDGAVAGEYKIAISKADPSSDVVSQEVDLDNPGAMYDSMMAGDGTEVELESMLPAKYASPASTPETRTVQEGSNEFNIELKD